MKIATMRLRNGATERLCTVCHNWWPAARSHFTPSKHNSTGWHSHCKACVRLHVAERRARLADDQDAAAPEMHFTHRVVDARSAPPVCFFPSTWLTPIAGLQAGRAAA